MGLITNSVEQWTALMFFSRLQTDSIFSIQFILSYRSIRVHHFLIGRPSSQSNILWSSSNMTVVLCSFLFPHFFPISSKRDSLFAYNSALTILDSIKTSMHNKSGLGNEEVGIWELHLCSHYWTFQLSYPVLIMGFCSSMQEYLYVYLELLCISRIAMMLFIITTAVHDAHASAILRT